MSITVGIKGKKHINKSVDKTIRCHIVCQWKLMDITRKSKTRTRTNLIEVNDNISSLLHYCLQHG